MHCGTEAKTHLHSTHRSATNSCSSASPRAPPARSPADKPGPHPPRAQGARRHDAAARFRWHNVCPALPPQSLNPSRSAEAEIALNEKGPGFICFLLQPLSPPVYRHAVTSDNNAQRQQMLMSFLCSPHNKSIKTTSENYEPP